MEIKENSNNYKKFYWKYMWHVKGTLMLALFLSFFFGFWSFVLTWTLCSFVFHYEYVRVQKEKKVDERHEELISTISGSDPTKPKTRIELEQEELKKQMKEIEELFDKFKDNNMIGEA